MSPGPEKRPLSLGFLTIIENSDQSLLGGYLLLNAAGRPLEFHCTAPILPNRAQEILYGPTLKPYLYGEQIGKTVIVAAKNLPALICTDSIAAMTVEEHVEPPVLFVDPADDAAANDASDTQSSSSTPSLRVDTAHESASRLAWFRFRHRRVGLSLSAGRQRERIEQQLGGTCDSLDLAEPFDRIRLAIDEAHRGSS